MDILRRSRTLYQHSDENGTVQVIQRGDRRELCFGNHIIQSAISVSNPKSLQLAYTRAMMAAFLFAPQARKLLHIGLGAGSLPRFIHAHLPRTRQILVELNPTVIQVAFRYFFLPPSCRLEVIQQDGAHFVDHTEHQFDLIFQDAYHAEGVAPCLESLAYFQRLQRHLSPQGWLVANVWGLDSYYLKQIQGTLAAAFPELHTLSVRNGTNVVFFAGQAPGPDWKQQGWHPRAKQLNATLGIDMIKLGRRIQTFQQR